MKAYIGKAGRVKWKWYVLVGDDSQALKQAALAAGIPDDWYFEEPFLHYRVNPYQFKKILAAGLARYLAKKKMTEYVKKLKSKEAGIEKEARRLTQIRQAQFIYRLKKRKSFCGVQGQFFQKASLPTGGKK